MAFVSIVTLLLFYYIRPQDWVPGMAGFNMAKLAVAGCIIGLMQRSRSERSWKFMGSPHEWLMVMFLAFAVVTSADPMNVVSDLGVLVVFGFLTVHTLTTEVLLEKYLRWWLGALCGILFMATVTRIGWDICNSRDLLDSMDGRFCLQTYTMNNPNALGHTVVVALPMAYFLWFWSSTVMSKLRAVGVMIVTVSTVVATQSKGAYIAGAVSLVVSYLFGKKMIVQIVCGLLALAMGGTILATLPRMDRMKDIGSEEGVQGRMLAWAMARTVTLTNATGVGYKQFHAWIRWEGALHDKGSHSSFVKVGGDLGTTGLALYVGMLLACGRTLLQYKGLTDTMTRCRGALVSMLLGLVVSGWMLDRSYYTEVFCLIGAVAAYHQISVRSRRELALEELKAEVPDQEEIESRPFGLPSGSLKATSATSVSKAADDDEGDQPEIVEADVDRVKVPGLWTRLGLLDLGLAVLGCQLTLQFWDYVMQTIKP